MAQTILDAIKEANDEAEIPTLAFANIREFNAFMDSFNYSDYPVNIVVPFTSNGTHIGGRRKAVIPLQGWVLRRIPEDPLDLRSVKAEMEYIQPMRAKAIRFISKLLDTDVIDPEIESVTDSIRSEYAFLAAHLFGVSYTVNIPVVEITC
jgi:hypothetical protein